MTKQWYRLACRWGAKFGCLVLLLSLVTLAIANFIGAPLWAITLAAAGVLVFGNLWVHYLRPWLSRHWKRGASQDVRTGSSSSSSNSETSGSNAGGCDVGAGSGGGWQGQAARACHGQSISLPSKTAAVEQTEDGVDQSGVAAAVEQDRSGTACFDAANSPSASVAAGQPVVPQIELVIVPSGGSGGTDERGNSLQGCSTGGTGVTASSSDNPQISRPSKVDGSGDGGGGGGDGGSGLQLHRASSLRRRPSAGSSGRHSRHGSRGGHPEAVTPADLDAAAQDAVVAADQPVSLSCGHLSCTPVH